jgi:hypothetical protein
MKEIVNQDRESQLQVHRKLQLESIQVHPKNKVEKGHNLAHIQITIIVHLIK